MWSPQGCVAIETPCEATFHIQSLKWNPVHGNSLILIGKDQFCVSYLIQSNSQNQNFKNAKNINQNQEDDDNGDEITNTNSESLSENESI
jgi:hypothetical protein